MQSDVFRVRRATTGDEPFLRALRIQALTDDPNAFRSTLDRELERSLADWRRWLSPGATFLLDTSTGPKGLVAGVPDHLDAAIVQLMSMWVHPDLRGSGAADALVEAVLSWAESLGAQRVQLEVIQGNARAKRLYERHHFTPTGSTAVRARDGAIELQMIRLLTDRTIVSETFPD